MLTYYRVRPAKYSIFYFYSNSVSRSATFCAIMTTIERCKTEGVVDVFQVVKAMRVQKPGAIQTVVCSVISACHVKVYIDYYMLQEQYQSIYEAVLTFLGSFETYSNFTLQQQPVNK